MDGAVLTETRVSLTQCGKFSLKAAFLILQDTLPYIWESSLRGSSESSI